MRTINTSLSQWIFDPTAEFPFAVRSGYATRRPRAQFSPSVDIVESNEAYLMTVDLPGVDPATVELTVLDRVLRLKGERVARGADSSGSLRRIERSVGAFERSFTLPRGTAAEGIEVQAAHGALEIRIPKARAQQRQLLKIQGLVPAVPEVQSTA